MNLNNVTGHTAESISETFRLNFVRWNDSNESWIGNIAYDILRSASIAGSPAMPGFVEGETFHVHAEAFSYFDHSIVSGIQDWYAQARAMAAHWSLQHGRTEPIELPGTWCFVAQPWSNVFWHWICEGLVKISAFEAAGFTGGYIVPGGVGFVRRSLELLNIDPCRLHYCSVPYAHIEKLIVPHRFRAQIDLRNHLDAVDWLRTHLVSGQSADEPLKIYVARRDNRSIVNEDDLLTLLTEHGFRHVSMENLDFADQIALVSRTGIFAGPHGSAFAHTMFMPRRSSIVEIFSPTYVNPCMLTTSMHLNQDYAMVVGYTDAAIGQPRDSPILANIELVKLSLERAEALAQYYKSRRVI
ncbi:glycosyltransferase family 61 protein [Methylobacterium sp. J-048]|uniref:glycosyltransferase family 61 protein n=1 Tax=Methylobacterium sp. J-048 TaxID=2836635 RepID=UPI001FBA76D1|nr:glycosyltransferase family 61 protein [Methylobacterium sp. J-048]MCJ2055817.1 glycosyltransferase family 61 protein [Methylobacterium sp. J-048]